MTTEPEEKKGYVTRYSFVKHGTFIHFHVEQGMGWNALSKHKKNSICEFCEYEDKTQIPLSALIAITYVDHSYHKYRPTYFKMEIVPLAKADPEK